MISSQQFPGSNHDKGGGVCEVNCDITIVNWIFSDLTTVKKREEGKILFKIWNFPRIKGAINSSPWVSLKVKYEDKSKLGKNFSIILRRK